MEHVIENNGRRKEKREGNKGERGRRKEKKLKKKITFFQQRLI